ncbi:MAG: hypothetical protein CVU22_02530 [Betaproteobacteria bacterium HGW-Betaproteobacteria-16]|nr:MAG: hypothetical protein CVU22_02530 [Betaproteobacteria bacterium HGW-Betaproteobacteria-16]
MNLKTATFTPAAFVEQLQALPSMPNVFNPWRDYDEHNDSNADAPTQRAEQLRLYFEQRLKTTRLVLVAEAPSWRGAKFTGIAMTSERILCPERPNSLASKAMLPPGRRTSCPGHFPRSMAEQTATIVWSKLLDSGFRPDEFVLWNAFPCHPYEVGNPRSNRRPKLDELKVTAHIFPSLLTMLRQPKVIAVGRIAETALHKLDPSATSVRHPAMGGATKFREAMEQFVKNLPRQNTDKRTQHA